MKIKNVTLAALAAAALLLPSCGYYWAGYAPAPTVAYSAYSYDTGTVWVEASYDSNGFPIFGYYYGQPVYGYTAAGAAVFALADLAAYCYVPHWGPAPWYHGPRWRYPSHCYHVGAPPHFPHGHRPGIRPHGGMHSPINRHPGSFFGGPGKPGGHRPAAGGGRPGGSRPAAGGGRPGGSRPAVSGGRPGGSRPAAGGGRPGGSRPAVSGGRPGGSRPAAAGGRPSGSRPAMGGGRTNAPRASMGGGHRGGFGGGGHRGGHGGFGGGHRR